MGERDEGDERERGAWMCIDYFSSPLFSFGASPSIEDANRMRKPFPSDSEKKLGLRPNDVPVIRADLD